MRSFWLKDARRVVVKIGTSALTANTRTLNKTRIEWVAEQIAEMRRRGIQTILVTSGAIGAGMGRLRLKKRPSKISELQAAASVGQSLLMKMYEEALRPYGLPAAQALLTTDDLQNRRRYVNFTNALNALFNFGAVPILNENDAVATEEIRVGDNDTLSAHTAVAVGADLLILLSDTDGVFTADPRRRPDAERIPIIHEIDAETMRMADESPGGYGTQLGTGRLLTKLKAAQTAGSSGIPTALAHGGRRNSAIDILDGKDVGTFFIPKGERKTGKKRWISHALDAKGVLVADEGARKAVVERSASLLPAGVRSATGEFQTGDLVRCVGLDGVEFARGLVNYGAEEINKILGMRADEIMQTLGYHYADEAIHRDNLVLVENG